VRFLCVFWAAFVALYCFLPWLRWLRPFWLGLPVLVLYHMSSVSLCKSIFYFIALSFVSGRRAFSSVSLCKSIYFIFYPSRGRFGSLALPFAGATRPCVGRARTSRRVPPAGLRCTVSPSPRLRLFRPVSRPVCGFGVSGSASLCVA
jgi:hypothetical protein